MQRASLDRVSEAVERQNAAGSALRRSSDEREIRAADALAAVRRTESLTRARIEALTAQIAAGQDKRCDDALAIIRADLKR